MIALIGPTATARPHTSTPTAKTCDGKSVVFHRQRARALLRKAYESEPSRAEIRAYQIHKRCIHDQGVRKALAALRDRLKEKLEQDPSSWCSPSPVSDGGGCWEIPEWCVHAESGGSWTAHNPTSPARGPYQLLGHGEPWPVTTREQAMAHHRIAAGLYASSGLSPWVAC